jgi:hypothetical protein
MPPQVFYAFGSSTQLIIVNDAYDCEGARHSIYKSLLVRFCV